MGGYIGATAVGLTTTAADVQGDITSTDTTPEVILKNTTETDADGSRDGKITFKGEQSGGEESTLAQIQSSHDGTADDQKGDLIFKTNDGSDGASPTERLRIDSGGVVTITRADNGTQLNLKSTDADGSGGPILDLTRDSATPADGDVLGLVRFKGDDAGGNETTYAQMIGFIEDEAAGAEDGTFKIETLIGGSSQARLDMTSTETVFNEGSIDSDFRIESNTDVDAFFLQGSDSKIGINESSPLSTLHVRDSGSENGSLRVGGSGAALGLELLYDQSGATTSTIQANPTYTSTSQLLKIRTDGDLNTNQLVLKGDGSVCIGKDNTTLSNAGIAAFGAGLIEVTRSGSKAMTLNRLSSDGEIINIRKAGSTVGSIGTASTVTYMMYYPSTGLRGGSSSIIPATTNGAATDNTKDWGASSYRWDDIFATNGTIQTSDENEKQDIASLTTAEITAATAISKLFKTFKWKDKVAAKGDNARTHTGVVAQQVQTAMSNAGLDASKYAFWCSDTWWEKDVEVAAVEADEEKDIEAADAYTRTDQYYTKDEAPSDATERTRMGIRYPELLAFVGAATEQRLTSIESRLTALEG